MSIKNKIKKTIYLQKLRRGPLTFTFTKRDGTTRVLTGTLRNAPETSGGPRKHTDDIITLFDVDIQDWRSIRLDSIQEVKEA